MTAPAAMPPTFSPSSLLCRHAISSTLLASSSDAGWTSVLIEHNRVQPDEEPFETHPTPDQTIVAMLGGEQEIEVFGGGTWRRAVYRAGTVGMTQGGTIDRLRRRLRRGSAAFEKVNLYMPQRFLEETAEHYRRAGQHRGGETLGALAFSDPLIAQTALSLLRAMAEGGPDLYAQAAMQWLATHLLSAHGACFDLRNDRRDPGVLSDRRLARVIEYMGARLAEPLTLDDLASEAGVSKFHFNRLFRGRMGMTPCAFLVQLRIELARRLLKTTDLRVAEIAGRCGFARASHFGTAFTKHVGVSPVGFRSDKLPR